jgi:hypothetical protein
MADHYFAVTGSGSGTGADADNPQTYSSANLNTAEAAASTGDTIFFLDGDYNDSPDFTNNNGNSLTYKSLNNQGAKFYVTKSSGDSLDEMIVDVTAGQTSTIDGFRFENMRVWCKDPTTVRNCKFYTTTSLLSGARGIVRHQGTGATFHDCVFHYLSHEGNTSLASCQSGCDFQRCSFSFDLSAHTSSVCTALGLDNALTLKNCIISADASTFISSSIAEFSDTAVNCCINNMGAVNDQGGGTGDGTNNVFADPQYVDSTTGDLRLRPSSPCINAGTAS